MGRIGDELDRTPDFGNSNKYTADKQSARKRTLNAPRYIKSPHSRSGSNLYYANTPTEDDPVSKVSNQNCIKQMKTEPYKDDASMSSKTFQMTNKRIRYASNNLEKRCCKTLPKGAVFGNACGTTETTKQSTIKTHNLAGHIMELKGELTIQQSCKKNNGISTTSPKK